MPLSHFRGMDNVRSRRRRRTGMARVEILVAAGLGIYVIGTLGYLAFGATFFVALAFIVGCVAVWLRASSMANRKRALRERRRRRSQRIAAHDAFWLEDRAA